MNFKQQLLFELRQAIDHDYYPSLKELATWLGLPYSTVHYRLSGLEADEVVIVYNRGRNGSPLVILPTDDETPK
jgi:hypothetical protein